MTDSTKNKSGVNIIDDDDDVNQEWYLNTEPKEIIETTLNPFGLNPRLTDKMRDALIELIGGYLREIIRLKDESKKKLDEANKLIAQLEQQIANLNRTDNSDPYAHNPLDFGRSKK